MFLSARATILATIGLTTSAASAPTPVWAPFDEASIFVEYNATDGDAEVVLDVDADVGLSRFVVVNPRGKVVLDLHSKHTEDLGIRKIALETPEPSLEAVLAAYPAGTYLFLGRSTDGQSLLSAVHLSHALPEAPAITFPLDGAKDVAVLGTLITWTSGPDAESFFFELESEDDAVSLKASLNGGTSSFDVPDGFLYAGAEFQVGVGARCGNGNLTVVEHAFTTAK